jgi:spermidine/putrescine transport system ATP-binding protein
VIDPLLVLDNVSKRYSEQVVVSGVNLAIDKSEFVAIIGPSGCGKTTTLRMIAGIEIPDEGEIRLGGRRMNEVKPWDRDTPLVWQSLALFPFMSVLKNVEFGLKMRGVSASERRARALKWLDRLDIARYRDRRVEKLSGGERQRVALARALITEPELLLLDEPMSALDANLVIRMQAELKQLQQQLGITFCYVTHNQSEALAMADRVVIMSEGRIQQVGTPREVYRAPASRFVAEFVGANNILSGRVRDIAGSLAVIATRFGPVSAKLHDGSRITPGSSVDIVLSADRIELGAPNGSDQNRVSGRVVGEEFVGAFVTIHFDIGEGTMIRVQTQQHTLEALNLGRGSEVTLAWRPEHTILLPAKQPT